MNEEIMLSLTDLKNGLEDGLRLSSDDEKPRAELPETRVEIFEALLKKPPAVRSDIHVGNEPRVEHKDRAKLGPRILIAFVEWLQRGQKCGVVMQPIKKVILLGSGGGTSGRAMAFSLGRPGSNPRSDFGFFQFRTAVNLFSLGVGLFLITCNRMVHTLPSSFL